MFLYCPLKWSSPHPLSSAVIRHTGFLQSNSGSSCKGAPLPPHSPPHLPLLLLTPFFIFLFFFLTACCQKWLAFTPAFTHPPGTCLKSFASVTHTSWTLCHPLVR